MVRPIGCPRLRSVVWSLDAVITGKTSIIIALTFSASCSQRSIRVKLGLPLRRHEINLTKKSLSSGVYLFPLPCGTMCRGGLGDRDGGDGIRISAFGGGKRSSKTGVGAERLFCVVLPTLGGLGGLDFVEVHSLFFCFCFVADGAGDKLEAGDGEDSNFNIGFATIGFFVVTVVFCASASMHIAIQASKRSLCSR